MHASLRAQLTDFQKRLRVIPRTLKNVAGDLLFLAIITTGLILMFTVIANLVFGAHLET